MRVHPLRWKATRRFSSSRAAFARRLTGHERRPPEETCELVVGPTRSSSIFVRALSMSCTLLSHRSCSVVESDCSKALTCGLWDTNALNLQRRRRPRMLFCGTKGPLTPNNRLQRTGEPHPIMWTPRPNAGCFSSEIDSYRIALEGDGYLTGISPLRARCIVLVGEALVNRGREDA